MDILEYHKSYSKDDLIKRLDEREIALIEKFDSYYNGLNGTKGGRNGSHPRLKTVQRFDLDGNFICEYESVSDLRTEFNSLDSIYCCCNNKINTAFGSIWRYKDSDIPLPLLSDVNKRKIINKYFSTLPIKKYDYKGNLICIYKDAIDVIENENITRRQLTDSCSGKVAFAGGYIYRYNHDSFFSHKTYDSSKRIVEKYSIDGDLIDVYESIAEAARMNGVEHTSIYYACSGKLTTVCGYIWKYGDIKGGDNIA